MAGFPIFNRPLSPNSRQTAQKQNNDGYGHNPLLSAAFDLMWSYYPEPVMLIHRSMEIMRVNEAARQLGRHEGCRCSSFGTAENHQGCLAVQMLASGRPQSRAVKRGYHDLTILWLPLAGFPDYFIHLSVLSEMNVFGDSSNPYSAQAAAYMVVETASAIASQLPASLPDQPVSTVRQAAPSSPSVEAAFAEALRHTLTFEGGYANVAGDRGGETFRGIARNMWPQWPGWPLIDGVKRAGMVTAKAIDQYFQNDMNMERLVADFYRQNFWQPFECLALPARAMAKLFDTAINMGPKPVIKFLQESLNALNPCGPSLAVDGIMGKGTKAVAAAVFANPNVEQPFLDMFCKRQEAYYRGIVARRPGQAKFLKGWLRRAAWKPS